jgi:hypothetical protein
VEHLNSRVISDDTTAHVVSDDAMGPAISAGAHTYRSDTFQVIKLDSTTSQVLKVDLGNGHAISDGAAADVVPDAATPFSRAASADADARVVCDSVAALNHPSDTFQVLKSKLDTFQVLKSKPPTFQVFKEELGDSAATGAARTPSSPVPLAGFRSTLPSPYYFGAAGPSLPLSSSEPTLPPPTADPGQGLPFRATPTVTAHRATWLRQIDKLTTLGGADLTLLAEVRKMIATGIRSEFKDGPPPARSYGNTFTFKANASKCTDRLRVYRDMGALHQLSEPPALGSYTQPLHGVLKPGKKARVCVDLSRNFNDFLVDVPFQYSSVKSTVDLTLECPTASYFVKLDISSCFLSFPLHPADYNFFVVEAGGDFHQFLCMMFDLKSAPRITLLLDVVSSAIADAGIAHVRYLDDFFIVGSTALRAWASAHEAARIIIRSCPLPREGARAPATHRVPRHRAGFGAADAEHLACTSRRDH